MILSYRRYVDLSQIADKFNKYNFMISLEPNIFRWTTWRVVRQSIVIAPSVLTGNQSRSDMHHRKGQPVYLT